MKRTFVFFAAVLCVAATNASQSAARKDKPADTSENPVGSSISGTKGHIDTLRTYELQEVQVLSTRAGNSTPMSFTDMNRQQIDAINHGKDVPWLLLNTTPSVTVTSDAGMGIGYTGIHIRGTDPTRINVTCNGVPMNDSESSQLYWVNMGDFASSLQSIQVQRGAGTSTNGAGAFGATVNMQTENISHTPFVSLDVSGGSYGTHKETLRFGTGILGGHWGVQGRLSNIGSDGYIERASSKLNSYFVQAGYFADKSVVKFITFNGTEKTYMAWDYASKADMQAYGRDYNPSGAYTDADGNTAYYSNQTDNYHQQSYYLMWNHRWKAGLKTNITVHYTHGDGYYEQMKTDQKLYKYGLDDDGLGLRADLVRQKKMENDFYGTVASIIYDNQKGFTATAGGGWNKYDGEHWGKVVWTSSAYTYDDDGNKTGSSQRQITDPEHEYYRNNAKKTDGNIYAKATYEFAGGLTGFVDMQYRHVVYKMTGMSAEWNDDGQIPLVLDRKFNFLNPKVGVSYDISTHHNVYASYSIAHKEPTRNDYEDMIAETDAVDPQAERLNDLEIGYKYTGNVFAASVNFYYMDYDNQFVLTGAQDSNGEMVARNVKDSYRMGVEMTASLRWPHGFSWDINATWSRNRAKNMTVTVINDDWTQSYANVGTTHLSFSPDFILNNIFTYERKGVRLKLVSRYVSEQYMTNSGFKKFLNTDGETYTSAMIDEAFVSDLDVSYTFKLKGIKRLTLGVTIYNLFDCEYESNGSCSMNFKYGDGKIVAYDGGWAWSTYSAQAPTHFIAYLSVNI